MEDGSPAQVGGPSLFVVSLPNFCWGVGDGYHRGGGIERSVMGERTILASDKSGGGSFQILHCFESQVDTPLTGDLRSSSSPSRGAFTSSFARLGGGALEDNDISLGYDVNRGGVVPWFRFRDLRWYHHSGDTRTVPVLSEHSNREIKSLIKEK